MTEDEMKLWKHGQTGCTAAAGQLWQVEVFQFQRSWLRPAEDHWNVQR
jgi:hypothetical protein